MLPNGQVLVAGGYGPDCCTMLASAELYDPATGKWTATGSMTHPRVDHTATLLQNGQVLVAGGCTDQPGAAASAELYDPATGVWTATGSMTIGRVDHTATLLQNGQVLVAGGCCDFTEALNYDPATGVWTATGAWALSVKRIQRRCCRMEKCWWPESPDSKRATIRSGDRSVDGDRQHEGERTEHTATLLPNGQVLVAGVGTTPIGGNIARAELYDPASGSWTITASLRPERFRHAATLLRDGRVLFSGGQGNGIFASAELYKSAPEMLDIE